MKKIQRIKGTRDILPEESAIWQGVETHFFSLCERFGYFETRIPTFEATELFSRGVGETTDIVQKEMYTFEDRGGRSLTLRPEATAGVIRSFIENGLASKPFPYKLAYAITAFRAENVQKGRYREFRQLGAEAIGSKSPEIDVDIISLIWRFFQELGLQNIELHLNSIGTKESRKAYNDLLKKALEPYKDRLCPDCLERFARNPLRLLDCKVPVCHDLMKEMPSILEALDEDSFAHHKAVEEGLKALDIPFVIDPFIVRGLDYYTQTVFEFVIKDSSSGQSGTLCGGGRYDGLIEALGGPKLPAIGFSIGEDRVLLALEAQNLSERYTYDPPALYLVSMDESAKHQVMRLAYELRSLGWTVSYDLQSRSFKSQMKQANKSQAVLLMVLGGSELESGRAELRALNGDAFQAFNLDLSDAEGISQALYEAYDAMDLPLPSTVGFLAADFDEGDADMGEADTEEYEYLTAYN